MFRKNFLLGSLSLLIGATANGNRAFAKVHRHHSGSQLLGNNIKTDGEHVIDKPGRHRVAVRVVRGKVAGLHVTKNETTEVQVKKYKTNKRLAQADGFRNVSFELAQSQDLGMAYIGYSFVDDLGDEQIYWFPYEMILDGYTGAVDYVPLA